MKKSFYTIAVSMLICCQLITNAQQKESPGNKNNPEVHNIFPYKQNGLEIIDGRFHLSNTINPKYKKPEGLNKIIINKHNYSNSDLSDFIEFPNQDPQSNYPTFVPVALSGDSIMMISSSPFQDTLYSSISIDGGLNWGNQKIILITETDSLYWLNSFTAIKTSTGRILVCWSENLKSIYSIYSDNSGSSWSNVIKLSDASNYVLSLQLTETKNSIIYLTYGDIDGHGGGHLLENLLFRTSMDNGKTWSAEKNIPNLNGFDPVICSGIGNNLLLFYYQNNLSGPYGDSQPGSILKSISTDGGITWSAGKKIFNSAGVLWQRQVLQQNGDSLYMIFTKLDSLPFYEDEYSASYSSHLFYSKSSGDGEVWSSPIQITRYDGQDIDVKFCIYNNMSFFTFSSDRWQSFAYSHTFYGVIGKTTDKNPPPAFYGASSNPSLFIPEVTDNIILGTAVDEKGIKDMKVNLIINGIPGPSFQMYDDSLHGDGKANDGKWGAEVGPFTAGDSLEYTFTVTDVDGNTVDFFLSYFNTYVAPTHNKGNIKLALLPNSQLGAGDWWVAYQVKSTNGNNDALWNGQDYLSKGGLWIGTIINNEKRVMNLDWYETDWQQSANSRITEKKEISDQDIEMTYDDRKAASTPIGLQVTQKSYQWENTDFIIFKYSIKNSGLNNNLKDIYAGLWLDADVTIETNNYNVVAYDSVRSMIYMKDNLQKATGYIGLKLLSSSIPYAVNYENVYTIQTDSSRFNEMSINNIPQNLQQADYEMLLTAQPFDLNINESKDVSFGLVMGKTMSDLETNADAMQMKFNSTLTGVDESSVINQLPKVYQLFQNYPNPFNPSTTIKYSIPKASFVTLKVYDILGREVTTLVNGDKPAGNYQIQFNASSLASGIYFYKIQAGSFSAAKKFLLLK